MMESSVSAKAFDQSLPMFEGDGLLQSLRDRLREPMPSQRVD